MTTRVKSAERVGGLLAASLLAAMLVAMAVALPVAAQETQETQEAQEPVEVWPKVKPETPEEPEKPEKKGTDAESDQEAAQAGSADVDSDAGSAGSESAKSEKKKDKEPSVKEKLGIDPCAVPASPEEAWVDRMQKGVFWTVCSTARWFDGFYGEPEDYDEYRSTYGRLGVAVEYDEQGSRWDLDTRFKARYEFPNLERKLDAFVGRVDEEDFVEGRGEDFGSLPPIFQETDAEWLAGLGYSPAHSARSRFDVDGGVRIDFPMDPFVRARWRTIRPLGSKRLFRFSQTAFWRRSLGTGTTSAMDIERALSRRLLARASASGTVAEEIDGLDWRVASTLYHLLREDTALAYQLEGRGQTDDEIPVYDWSVGMIYRQRVWREWLFLELRGRVHWPRQELEEEREPEAGFAVGFEILFGDHPSITRRHPSWELVDERVREAAERAKQRAREEAAASEESQSEESPLEETADSEDSEDG